jgi:hypothetical protein
MAEVREQSSGPLPLAIIREPDDKLADVRISLGEKRGAGVYLVFRGKPESAAALLRMAGTALAEAIEGGHYADQRGRPQG